MTRFLGEARARERICGGLANEALWDAAVERISEPLGELWTILRELQAMESDERAAGRFRAFSHFGSVCYPRTRPGMI